MAGASSLDRHPKEALAGVPAKIHIHLLQHLACRNIAIRPAMAHPDNMAGALYGDLITFVSDVCMHHGGKEVHRHLGQAIPHPQGTAEPDSTLHHPRFHCTLALQNTAYITCLQGRQSGKAGQLVPPISHRLHFLSAI